MAGFSTPEYTKLVPLQFRTVKDNSAVGLEKYEINPVILTAYLMEQLDSKLVFYSGLSIEEFKIQRNFNEVFFNQDITIDDPSAYKGFLAFKGTKNDLIYMLRQLNYDVTINEYLISGILDNVFNVGVFANAPGGEQFTFSNPENPVKYGQSVKNQDLTKACKIGLSINVNLNEAQVTNIIDAYNDLSRLLVNRLYVGTNIDEITLKYKLKDIANNFVISDNKFAVTLGVALGDNTFATIKFNNEVPVKFNNSAPFSYERGLLDSSNV